LFGTVVDTVECSGTKRQLTATGRIAIQKYRFDPTKKKSPFTPLDSENIEISLNTKQRDLVVTINIK
jgi:hypothetical protein